MPFTDEELKKIREELPRGSSLIIAKRLGIKNPGHVRNVLSGLANNEDIVLEAVGIIAENRQKVEKAKSTLNSLA